MRKVQIERVREKESMENRKQRKQGIKYWTLESKKQNQYILGYEIDIEVKKREKITV